VGIRHQPPQAGPLAGHGGGCAAGLIIVKYVAATRAKLELFLIPTTPKNK
jgi:hypothetical protein